ncbi:MAG: hypothetical protein IJ680_03125 [Paludibacteraceae bacterium]|nr:hypothetical protein [Paludibacteraceae bacterium]
MKKFFSFLMAFALAGAAMAEVKSYTLVFKDTPGTTDSDGSSARTTIADILNEGAEYVTDVTASRVYNARENYGIKFGTSSVAGSISFTLKDAVKADSVVFTACSYSKTEGTVKLMGREEVVDLTNGGGDNKVLKDYAVVYDGNTEITTVSFETTAKRAYLTKIAVYWTEGSAVVVDPNKPATAAPSATVYPASKVASIYSDVYGVAPGFNIGGWGQSTQRTEETVDGDKYYYLTNFNYEGWQFDPLITASMDKMHLDIWSATAGHVKVTPINTNAESDPKEAGKAIELNPGWNSFDFDLATDYATISDRSQFTQFKFATDELTDAPSFFAVDNLYFYSTSAATDTEKPTNVTATPVPGYFDVTIKAKADDNSGAVIFEVYDGETLVGKGGAASGAETGIAISGLKTNTAYALSVVAMDADGNKADAVTVNVTTLQGPTAATAPTHAAMDVISLYSDAYTAATWFVIGGWGQATATTEVELAENDKAYMLTNFNWLGLELNNNVAAFDASEMKYLHLDVWAPEANQPLRVTPIWGSEAPADVPALNAGWNAVDMPLTTWANINLANIYQIKFDGGVGGTYFIDNVYFWKEGIDVNDTLTCADAAKLAATKPEGTYKAQGYVTEIATPYSTQNNNISFWMADAEDGGRVLEAYRATGDDAVKVKVGDFVVVEGTLTAFNKTMEFAEKCVVKILKEAAALDTITITIPEALTMGAALDSAAVSKQPVYVAGKIIAIEEVSTKNGNATFTISDGTNDLICYRVKSVNNVDFTSEDEIKVDAEVVMMGYIKNYVDKNSVSTIELVNGWIKEYTEGAGIKQVNAQELVNVVNGQLFINAQPNDLIQIYAANGQLLYNAKANGMTLVNGLQAGQMIVVRVNDAVAKVVL